MKNWSKLYTDTCDNNHKVMRQLADFICNTIMSHGSPLKINNSVQYSISLDNVEIVMHLHKNVHSCSCMTVTYKNGYFFNCFLEDSDFIENGQMHKLFLICDKLEEKYGK